MGRIAIQDQKSSLSFNGGNTVDRRIDVTTPLAIGLTSDFTVGGWVYYRPKTVAGNNDTHTLFNANFNYAADKGYLFQAGASNGVVSVFTGNTNNNSSSGVLKYSRWNYLLYEITGTTANIYVNDMVTPAATLTITRRVDGTLANKFGSEVPGTLNPRRIDGYLSSHFAANRILTSAEKIALMNGTSIPANLGVYYKLNEGAGSTAYDSSGNANNGTITNGTWVSDTPTKKRKVVGGNLVKNGDMSYAPPFTAATTTAGRWIDGTAAGSTSASNIFGWGLYAVSGTGSAMFDTSTSYRGSCSLKISLGATASYIETGIFRLDSAAGRLPYDIPVLPNTSYTASFYMKTLYVSGDASTGPGMNFIERNGVSTFVANNLTVPTKATTDWTKYTVTFTTAATTRFVSPTMRIYGHQGAGTLIMDAWFSQIELRPTVPETRLIATGRTLAGTRLTA